MNQALRLGILGFGRHAENALYSIARSRAFDVTAIASQGSRFKREKHKISPQIYESYDALLKDSALDAVYVCLPNSMHAEWCTAALNAGKHVICEKPLCLKHADAVALQALAARAGKKLCTGFMYRFHPQHTWIRGALAEGRIGELRSFEGCFQYQLTDPENIRLQSEYGGGALLDVGCYLLDVVELISGRKIVSLRGSWKLDPDSGVDLETILVVRLEENFIARLECSMRRPRANYYVVKGANDSLKAAQAFRIEPTQKVEVEIARTGEPVVTQSFPAVDQTAEQFKAFAAWIGGDEAAGEQFADCSRNVALLEAARRACEDGKEVWV